MSADFQASAAQPTEPADRASRRAGSAPAWAALHRALEEQATQGRWPACANPSLRQLWLSESRAERAEAALWCVGCPILTQCEEAAEASAETFGVWGGVDRTPQRRPTTGEQPADQVTIKANHG